MNLGWDKYLLWMLIVALIEAHHLHSCVEDERLGLLRIKSYFESLPADVKPWSDNGQRYNCCAWERILCNPSTGRVTQLDLSSLVSSYSNFYTNGQVKNPWLFNVTLFHPFKELISLDLSYDYINGLVEYDGSTTLSTLKHLKFLKLDGNYFQNGHVSVGALTELKNLTLKDCDLNQSIGLLANLVELQVLNLKDNSFHGHLQDLCRLKNLKELGLSGNLLSGGLPSCLDNLTSLQFLDLSVNHLSGRFPNVLSNLTSLRHLSLSDNYFEGIVSLSSLANLSNLEVLLLSRNNLEVQMGDSSWKPTFQLQALGLGGCNLNKTYKAMPFFLLHQPNLTDIDLSNNYLFGAFPAWLLNINTKLKAVYLANNFLTGSLQLNGHANSSLSILDISSNNFQGELPQNIGLVFPWLTYLNISGNHLEGHIPATIGLMKSLKYLDLSRNNLSGALPTQLLSDCSSLEILALSHNSLEGDIIPDYMNLPNLSWLKLNNNSFGGTIKDSLKSFYNLYFLDISNNKVMGQLSSWIGNLSELYSLSASDNLLHGDIPTEICNLGLSYLDLSRNEFTGHIPSCFTYSNYLHLQQNSLTGPIPDALLNNSLLLTLDLRDNQLSGSIPQSINKPSSLRILLLGGNNLEGQPPDQMCQLGNIDILDLSRNRFSGALPTCFWNMSFGVRTIDLYDNDPLAVDYWNTENVQTLEFYPIPEEVEFLVKNQYLSYVGGNLHLMSGLDLSCNKFTGIIPPELGHLVHVHSLNLSHNYLTGTIPGSFSYLKEIESLDLSCNDLSGMIPPQLSDLNFLAIFNVSYNNLTGRTPETRQFASFDQSNYLGNPGLCGSTIKRTCERAQANTLHLPLSIEDDEVGSGLLDMEDFFWSFGVSSSIALVATISVLCINPQWRGAWFNFLDHRVLWWLH